MRFHVSVALVAASLLAFAQTGQCDSLRVRLDYPGAISAQPPSSTDIGVRGPRVLKRITIPGFSGSTSSGDPQLPCKTIFVALPPDANPESIRVVPGSLKAAVMPGYYDVPPTPPVAEAGGTLSWGMGKQIENGRNTLTYGADRFYPLDHVRVVSVGNLRSWKIAEIEFWPYCYNPLSGRLRAITTNSASIVYAREASAPPPADPAAARMSGFVANREEALDWYAPAPQAGAVASYVIVTTNAIASASTKLTAFAQFQQARGFTTKIVTETDWGGGTGNTAADNIRRWLVNNYASLGIEYVLLIGDSNPTIGDVPMKMLWPRHNEPSYREAPSDYYYADLTGNWDRDRDGYAGESPDDFGSGGVDRIPEVYAGRIPYHGSIQALDSILQKTIDYESASLGEWSRRVLLPMKTLDDWTACYQLGEQIVRDAVTPSGMAPVRVYDDDYNLAPPPEHYPCDYGVVQQEWEQGAGVVVWMTHGSTNLAASVFTSQSCSALDDSKPSIVYMGACSNGKPEDSSNLGYSLLQRGAVATESASRVSWYYIGETDFTNSDSIGGLGYRYTRFVLSQKQSCARAMMSARLAGPLGIWPNHLVYNLYGDPSLVFDQPLQGAVAGSVLSVDGLPIPGACIRTAEGTPATFSQTDGSYVLAGFDAETEDIVASADGYYTQRFYGVSTAPGSLTKLDFRLRDAIPGSISGKVLDIYGAPVYDASVAIPREESLTYSRHDGSYSFAGVLPGTYTLTASKPAWGQGIALDCSVPEAASTTVDLVLVPQTGNLLANGGFEEGFADSLAYGWEFYSSPGYGAMPIPGFDRFRIGSASQKLYMPQPTSEDHAGFRQTVRVTPGKTYTLVGWGRNHLGGAEFDWTDSVVTRLGWDPTGGVDYGSTSVTWKKFDGHHDYWYVLFTDVEAYGDSLAVFLDVWRRFPSGGDDCYSWFDGLHLVGPVELPRAPSVSIATPYVTPGSAISASWTSAEPDVLGFEWAVSETAGENGIVPGGEWTAVGAHTSGTRAGLALRCGQVVRALVRSVSISGLKSQIGVSEPVKVTDDAASVGAAKLMHDGAWVKIPQVCVSRMGDGPWCYAQDLSRASGIRIEGTPAAIPYLQPGTTASVVGMLATRDGMRVLTNAELLPGRIQVPPSPLGVAGRASWSGPGLDVSGLLVTVWGRVTSTGGSGFLLSDGSPVGTLQIGCRGDAVPPAVGKFVRITGIRTASGMEVFSAADIIVIL